MAFAASFSFILTGCTGASDGDDRSIDLQTYPAKGICKDGTPPPCGGGAKKPGEESTGNNLSFPGILTSAPGHGPSWTVGEGELGTHFSYGCDKPQTVDTFSYPNTSCIDSAGAAMTAEECTAADGPCEGLPVDRMYWQKVEENRWQAGEVGPRTPVHVAYLDWGDNLESNTWGTTSVIRLETTPFTSLIPWYPPTSTTAAVPVPFDPAVNTCAEAALDAGLDPETACQLGFQMWHVSGHGPTEQWGARTEDTLREPYTYQSPFAIVSTSRARLHFAKLEAGSRPCATPGGDPGEPPPPEFFESFSWDPAGPNWTSSLVGDACSFRDIVFKAELNVGGKYVYGHNWMLPRDEMSSPCGPSWEKAGWWRLTFYTDNGAVLFDEANPVVATSAPPAVPAAPTAPAVILAEEPGETETLYTPVIDYENNLTYLDICISSGGGKGGGGGGGGPGGPGGPGAGEHGAGY